MIGWSSQLSEISFTDIFDALITNTYKKYDIESSL